MDTSYPKEEKLKSKKTIELLFSEGKSVSKFPLRLVYLETDFEEDVPYKIGVSVSKRNFKNAVDRNYFKRVLRECYRLNKAMLVDNLDKKYAIMFFYQTKERLTYQEIHEKTVQLFDKFIRLLKEENNNT